MEKILEIVSILVVIVLVFIIFLFINKSKNNNSSKRTMYSKESIFVLVKYFGEKNFLSNESIFDFKEKLEIKTFFKDDINSIIKDTKHRFEVHTSYCINNNKAYNDFTTFKLAANETLDYCVKKDISVKKGIILMLLTLENESMKELLDQEYNDAKFLELFYKLLPGFLERYNKRKDD